MYPRPFLAGNAQFVTGMTRGGTGGSLRVSHGEFGLQAQDATRIQKQGHNQARPRWGKKGPSERRIVDGDANGGDADQGCGQKDHHARLHQGKSDAFRADNCLARPSGKAR
jgi:hypothetical protein